MHSYLYSSQWETRIAAGLAVEAIATHVPKWQPHGPCSSGTHAQQTQYLCNETSFLGSHHQVGLGSQKRTLGLIDAGEHWG